MTLDETFMVFYFLSVVLFIFQVVGGKRRRGWAEKRSQVSHWAMMIRPSPCASFTKTQTQYIYIYSTLLFGGKQENQKGSGKLRIARNCPFSKAEAWRTSWTSSDTATPEGQTRPGRGGNPGAKTGGKHATTTKEPKTKEKDQPQSSRNPGRPWRQVNPLNVEPNKEESRERRTHLT